MKAIYQGYFVSEKDKIVLINYCMEKGGILSRIIKDPHITFKFSPTVLFAEEILGKNFKVKVIGYENDWMNEGFKVEIPDELKGYYDGSEVPHITVSVNSDENAKPVNTANLDFKEIEPFYIDGFMGVFTNKQSVVTTTENFE